MRYGIKAALCGAALLAASAAQAEVVQTSENGFVTRDVVVVDANLTQTWLALISPSDWWSSEHTWSGDAANLTIRPQAGGCFCEKIPEVDEPDRFTLEGSVEHMRVIQAYPNSALRMVGALGPLQSEPVTGVLTIALSEVDLPEGAGRTGTRVVWEYNVGGSMRYEIPVISKAVAGVMTLQLDSLAAKLGRVDIVEEDAQDTAEETSAPSDQVDDGAVDAVVQEDAPDEGAAQERPAPKKGPSVDEAFDDFGDFPDDGVTLSPEKADNDPLPDPPSRLI